MFKQEDTIERTTKLKKEAIRFSTIDSNIQLSIAFVINCLLLVLGASLFYGHGDSLGRFTDLYNALQDSSIVGVIASPLLSTLFAVALLALVKILLLPEHYQDK